MSGPTYPAARAFADRIHFRLSGNKDMILKSQSRSLPDAHAIEEVVTAAFWASLRREEGKSPTISLALVAPEQVARPLRFAAQLSLDPEILARLAPAVERPGIHLCVWRYNDGLFIWGTTRALPSGCFVLEVIAPGLLVVKTQRAEPTAKFANVAVLEGAQVKFIAPQPTPVFEGTGALASLLTFYASAGTSETDSVLVRLAISMRAHQRGGTLLVVPHESEEWRESIVKPISYSVNPPFSEINGPSDDPDVLRTAVDALAGWTAVDGATVISDHFALLASGVKIHSRDVSRRIGKVRVTEPVEGSEPMLVEPSYLGNTRHLSAAQFVHDQPDCVALVASQDGRFTVFAWCAAEDTVYAHRLEALLL